MADPMDIASDEEEVILFKDMGLDARLERAVKKMGWEIPTTIQQSALPFALSGKDLMVQARTGTGKTGCFALPVLQTLLSSNAGRHVQAVVMVPTKELSRQVRTVFEQLARYCGDGVTVVELGTVESVREQKTLLRDLPSIVVATPARIAARIKDRSLPVTHVSALVVDEADLVLGYGYAEDVDAVIRALPSARQTFLMSATLGDEVVRLQKEALNRPAVLTLEDEDDDEEADKKEQNRLQQLSVKAERASDKFLICYVMLRLQLIRGKTLIFVNSIQQAFRLRMFLKSFYISTGLLNSELPENSRNFILQEFDQGKFSVLVASDEAHLFEKQEAEAAAAAVVASHQAASEAGAAAEQKKTDPKRKRSQEQREYGVARGVDFQHVANVINFDFPTTPEAYVHRIGRTARAGARGKAISFVCSDAERKVLEDAALVQHQEAIEPFAFKMSAVEGFRYRVEDVLSTITKAQIKEARAEELKNEILRSKALKAHFEEHPRDLEVVKAAAKVKNVKRPELKKIPDYLRPTAQDSAQFRKALGKGSLSKKAGKKGGKKGGRRRRNDPLKSLQVLRR